MTYRCEGKVRFQTFAGADRAARRSRRKGDHPLNPYSCHECRGFHVGGTTGKKREARKPDVSQVDIEDDGE